MEILAHNIGVLGAFIVCLYFGFKFDSGILFVGAFIAFWCIK